MEKERLLERIIDRLGPHVQIRKIKEECLELALAITKLDIPTKDASETIENIYEEIADVQIMMEQADKIFDKEKIERIKKMKLEKAEKSDWLNGPLNQQDDSKSAEEEYVKPFTLCLATYPIGGKTDLLYCIPIKIGVEYSTCHLFGGEVESKLYYKGVFTDVCTADLQGLKSQYYSKRAQNSNKIGTDRSHSDVYADKHRV
jgi:NTP pyrophosphatase (non-canonical NTP hydrolase)